MPFAVIALLAGFAGALLTWPATRTRRTSQRVLLGLVWLWAAGVVSLTFGTPSGGGRPVNIALLDARRGDVGDARDRLTRLSARHLRSPQVARALAELDTLTQ